MLWTWIYPSLQLPCMAIRCSNRCCMRHNRHRGNLYWLYCLATQRTYAAAHIARIISNSFLHMELGCSMSSSGLPSRKPHTFWESLSVVAFCPTKGTKGAGPLRKRWIFRLFLLAAPRPPDHLPNHLLSQPSCAHGAQAAFCSMWGDIYCGRCLGAPCRTPSVALRGHPRNKLHQCTPDEIRKSWSTRC